METTGTKLTKAPHNNRFHGVGTTGSKREKGERLEARSDGTSALYIDGKFIAIVKS